jgi:hypothetical protein
MSIYQRVSISFGIVALLVAATLLALSTGKNGQPSLHKQFDEHPSRTDVPAATDDGYVSYDGVSFSFDKSLDVTVVPGKVEATPLANDTDKPDSVFPRHLLFRFTRKGELASFFKAELRIFPISEYKKQFASSKVAEIEFQKRLDEIKRLVAEKRSDIDTVPLLPFIDAESAFISKMEFSNFRNGDGIWFLTQFLIEPSTISNFGLTYFYEGITRDEKYFVYCTFPVNLPWLPSDSTPFSTEIGDSNGDFKEYLRTTRKKIENAPSTDFNPKLTILRKLISTLKVEASAIPN